MTSFVKTMDFGGLDLVVNSIKTGATKPGQTLTATVVPNEGFVVKHTTGATRTLTAAQNGTTVLLAKADGVIITLPAAVVGRRFKFVVLTSVTSNAYKLSTATQGTEFFDGSYNSFQDAAVASTVFTGDGATHDNLSMNGTTTGGLLGTVLWVECFATNLWTVTGWNRGSGAEVTSFATS